MVGPFGVDNVRFGVFLLSFAESVPPRSLPPRQGRQKLRVHGLKGGLRILPCPWLAAAHPLGPRHLRAIGPMGGGRRPPPQRLAARLGRLQHLQGVAEAFVLDNRALVDQAGVDIEGIGQCTTGDPDLNARVRLLKHLHVLPDQSPVVRGVGQHVELALVVQEQVLTHLAQFPPGQDQIQVFFRPQRAMRIVGVARYLGELRVVRLDSL